MGDFANPATVARFQHFERRLAAAGLYSGAIDEQWGYGVDAAIDRLFEKAGFAPRPLETPIPPAYQWLTTIGTLPKVVEEALKLLGTVELAGAANSPTIMGWRDELNAAGIKIDGYSADSVPWCGLATAIAVHRAGYQPVKHPLWALNWGAFGVASQQPCLGDILTFTRNGGGHVAFYIGEDTAGYYHVLGGNQSNAVNIMRIAKTRLHSARVIKYKSRPKTARPYILSATGAVSRNEA